MLLRPSFIQLAVLAEECWGISVLFLSRSRDFSALYTFMTAVKFTLYSDDSIVESDFVYKIIELYKPFLCHDVEILENIAKLVIRLSEN